MLLFWFLMGLALAAHDESAEGEDSISTNRG